MKKILQVLCIAIVFPITILSQESETTSKSKDVIDFTTAYEKSDGMETATYEQAILFYEKLAKTYPEISIRKVGKTDAGFPLHLVIFDNSKTFDLANEEKNTILINNGIHPGEPDGIDASMMMLRDIVQSDSLKTKYNNVLICIIPIYNIGGSLNRNSTSRVNQNGPISYGFRGNALNYDLNRDFIKNDTENAKSFAKIFHILNPDVFIDNHVSNGADYQYTLTHVFTQHNQLGGKIGEYLYHKMIPDIEQDLLSKNIRTTPYVNVFNSVPENGFSQFFDSPRYSTGYTTLFNTLGIMVETHMLKPYKQRVEVTYELMISFLDFTVKNGAAINLLRKKAVKEIIAKKTYPIQWKVNKDKYKTLDFKGYEGTFIPSEITSQKRLKYDRTKPFSKPVTYYDHFKAIKEITIPKYYVVPKKLVKIVERLKLNNIEMHPLKKDISIEVESYKIDDYKTGKSPFEGHYLHRNTVVTSTIKHQKFAKGDFLIPTDQPGIKYLLETLEPEAKDSFFNWNFFDIILQEKEGFSPYVFEDLAKEILENNDELRRKYEKKKEGNIDFYNSWYQQLDYIYKNSKYAEKAYLQYPIYRILN